MVRRPVDLRGAAEAAFKSVTAKPVEAPRPRQTALPGVKEQITLRLDQDVLDRFRETGPGWQELLNAALRKAVGF